MIAKNKTKKLFFSFGTVVLSTLLLFSCESEDANLDAPIDAAVFLVIDEESIDNGNQPNNFSETDVNDQLARVGLRSPLLYFQQNIGKEINLYTGDVGDEGWHAIKTIPNEWISTGPTTIGLENYLVAGPGLGGGEDNREVLLDEIPNVTPLRATGLTMLKGKTVVALVYDSDISTNYSPLTGNLMGDNLGVVAFDVLDVVKRTDGSTGSLPRVRIRIRTANNIDVQKLSLFENAPVPQSSSEPFDVTPPVDAPAPSFGSIR